MLSKAFRNFMIKRTISAKLRNKGMNAFSNYEILKPSGIIEVDEN